MARVKLHKTSFTSGEVSPELVGRGDLAAYENGASLLRNVLVRPTGSVLRRSGTRFVDVSRGKGRLLSFEFSTDQIYLLVFTSYFLDIYLDNLHHAELSTPWSEEHLKKISWTQSADTLLITHPEISAKKITRGAGDLWTIIDWSFAVQASGRVEQPHFRFYEEPWYITASRTTGTVTLSGQTTPRFYAFTQNHIGTRWRINDREVEIVAVPAPGAAENPAEPGWYDKAVAEVKEPLTDTSPTKDFTEQVFSAQRGWPTTVTFHQDRLVIGGSHSLPNRLWFSKSGDLFNFDLGTGLDDEAIDFAILSDQVNAIRAVFSGRHLQVFTSGAEWMVTGDPLTPSKIQLHRQTRVGSPLDRQIPPRSIDGATVFVPRNKSQLREFLFTDVEQAYQSTDLALLSRHLIDTPLDMDYDQLNRLLFVVMADGSLASLTVYRLEQVTAWTLHVTAGAFLSAAVVGDRTYLLVSRDNVTTIEFFDSSLFVDCGSTFSSITPKKIWDGFTHLEGMVVRVVADGAVRSDTTVQNGQIYLPEAASHLQVGLPFTHVVKPLPPQIPGTRNGNQGVRLRPISVTLRLDRTQALEIDLGAGVVEVPFRRLSGDLDEKSPEMFSGDKTFRMLGWKGDGSQPSWHIRQSVPMPFHLLSVTEEVSVND